MTFRAVLIDKADGNYSVAAGEVGREVLMDGDVTVRASHSTISYKDGLALTGKAPVVRRFPMIPGIDFADIVETSSHADFKLGGAVILNGWGVCETHHGGFAQVARVKSGWLVHLPSGLSPAEAMAIGTAGYTAMLAVMALERHGALPSHDPVIVTGAAGGSSHRRVGNRKRIT